MGKSLTNARQADVGAPDLDAANGTFSGTVTATEYNSTSDITLKENLVNIKSPLDAINTLNGYHFTWKENGDGAYGVVAQEIEALFPEMVREGKDGIKRVSYDSLIPVLIEAIKELKKKVEP